jgi:hypothetical protein
MSVILAIDDLLRCSCTEENDDCCDRIHHHSHRVLQGPISKNLYVGNLRMLAVS